MNNKLKLTDYDFRIGREHYNVSPIIFQCALWGRHSTYKNKKQGNPNQLEIEF